MDNNNTPQICILGAGFAGLTVALQLRRRLNWESFTIFDKNSEVGGVWLVNTYPGAECDFPSHYYSWSFEPNPAWSRNYAQQPEILAYIQEVARKYNLYPNCRLRTEVESVTWHEPSGKWQVVFKDLETEVVTQRGFDFVFSGVNFLWQPNKPPGFQNFQGPCLHTAEWNHGVVLDQKVVGVIGTGSSAVQVIPAIQPQVKQLHSFQRNPAWILPKRVCTFGYWTTCLFQYVPIVMTLYRWWSFWAADLKSKATVYRSKKAEEMACFASSYIRQASAAKPGLLPKIMPNCDYASRSVSLSNTYIPALASSKVEVHRGAITEIRSNSVVTESGDEIKLDILILATGFKSKEYFAPMKIIGVKGQDVLQSWKAKRPRNFLGVCSTLTPNLFYIGGPNGLVATGTALFVYECQVTFAVDLLAHMGSRQKNIIVVTKEAEDASMKEMDNRISQLVWGNSVDCDSWFKNSNGYVSISPFSAYEYWKRVRAVDYTKFEFK